MWKEKLENWLRSRLLWIVYVPLVVFVAYFIFLGGFEDVGYAFKITLGSAVILWWYGLVGVLGTWIIKSNYMVTSWIVGILGWMGYVIFIIELKKMPKKVLYVFSVIILILILTSFRGCIASFSW